MVAPPSAVDDEAFSTPPTPRSEPLASLSLRCAIIALAVIVPYLVPPQENDYSPSPHTDDALPEVAPPPALSHSQLAQVLVSVLRSGFLPLSAVAACCLVSPPTDSSLRLLAHTGAPSSLARSLHSSHSSPGPSPAAAWSLQPWLQLRPLLALHLDSVRLATAADEDLLAALLTPHPLSSAAKSAAQHGDGQGHGHPHLHQHPRSRGAVICSIASLDIPSPSNTLFSSPPPCSSSSALSSTPPSSSSALASSAVLAPLHRMSHLSLGRTGRKYLGCIPRSFWHHVPCLQSLCLHNLGPAAFSLASLRTLLSASAAADRAVSTVSTGGGGGREDEGGANLSIAARGARGDSHTSTDTAPTGTPSPDFKSPSISPDVPSTMSTMSTTSTMSTMRTTSNPGTLITLRLLSCEGLRLDSADNPALFAATLLLLPPSLTHLSLLYSAEVTDTSLRALAFAVRLPALRSLRVSRSLPHDQEDILEGQGGKGEQGEEGCGGGGGMGGGGEGGCDANISTCVAAGISQGRGRGGERRPQHHQQHSDRCEPAASCLPWPSAPAPPSGPGVTPPLHTLPTTSSTPTCTATQHDERDSRQLHSLALSSACWQALRRARPGVDCRIDLIHLDFRAGGVGQEAFEASAEPRGEAGYLDRLS